jgi:hypothetical protein
MSIIRITIPFDPCNECIENNIEHCPHLIPTLPEYRSQANIDIARSLFTSSCDILSYIDTDSEEEDFEDS